MTPPTEEVLRRALKLAITALKVVRANQSLSPELQDVVHGAIQFAEYEVGERGGGVNP